ncbi:Fic/DOC family N-terminal domain-containing protein [Propionivibrio sp.]|uniref:Fic/DOC family N-terminal domain-containing protein n=2 Tax=Propionivibrio sp. TaxID=2212460 RepID=UPI0025F625EC|nr:Fic/DOC family N-terminal domain-containing protein [Propionivibrio sp.]
MTAWWGNEPANAQSFTCRDKHVYKYVYFYTYQALITLRPDRFDRPDILKQLNAASRELAELKGVAASMPNQGILISTLGLQEAKDSSEIENIVTTHDELFREVAFPEAAGSAATKEVAHYRQALRVGFDAVRTSGLLTNNHILQIQAELEKNRAGFRKLPGTALKGDGGRTVYTPPQDATVVEALMTSCRAHRRRRHRHHSGHQSAAYGLQAPHSRHASFLQSGPDQQPVFLSLHQDRVR